VVNLSAPYPACSVVPAGDYTVNIRKNPNTNGDIVGTLNKAAWVKVASSTNGWYMIDYPGTPVHQMWVSGEAIRLTQPCSCGPTCVPQTSAVGVATPIPATGTCSAINRSSEPQPIYGRPDNTTPFIARMAPNTPFFVVSKTAGWYAVYIQALTSIGWVSDSTAVLQGACELILSDHIVPPPSTCTVTNTTGSTSGVFPRPDASAPLMARMPPNEPFTVISKSPGWYAVFVAALTSVGWVQESAVTANGVCN
jgi:hypothetical protein